MKRMDRLRRAMACACLAGAVCFLVAGDGVAQERSPTPAPGEGAAGGADLNVNERGTVELHVQGADLRRVLQLLSTQSKTNIIATKEVQGTVTADLYDVTFTEALEAVLKSAGFWYVRKANFITVMTPKQYDDLQAAQRQLGVKVFKLNYIKSSDAKTLIEPALSKDGSASVSPDAEVGVATSGDAAGGNNLAGEDVIVVKDYPENLQQITKILAELDVRPLQVLVEATILQADLTEGNALGIDFNTLAGVDFRGIGATSTGYTTLTPTANAVAGAQLDKAAATIRTDGFAGAVPAGGLTIGFISNNISFFVRALETVSDIVVLANPKLLIVNKQRGEVLVGNRNGYITTTISETTATQTVEFLETGTKLVVRPFVARDGYVRLEIHPEDSDGSVNVQGALALPTESTTELTTNVLVRDGHTIVIGGLFRENTTNSRSQIPGLGNIPWLGVLFRSRTETTDRAEIIILLTPHIIKHPPDEIVSEQMRDQTRRFRLGARQGLMWFGRDRLAQSHMRAARRHISAGRHDKALWDVNMAVSLEPRMEEAIRLKERLTDQAIWATESRHSSINTVVQRMIMQELGHPLEKVVQPMKPRDGMQLEKEIRDAMGIGVRPELPVDATPPWCVDKEKKALKKQRVPVTTRPAGGESVRPK